MYQSMQHIKGIEKQYAWYQYDNKYSVLSDGEGMYFSQFCGATFMCC